MPDAPPLRHSDKGVKIGGWESKDREYHQVLDINGDKIGREPSDRQLESARRVVIQYKSKWYTSGPLSPDLTLDDVISELEDIGSL